MVKAKVRRLAIPAALTVTTLGGLPACGDDGDGGEAGTSPTTMTSMTSSPTTTTMGTTDAVTATSTDSGSSAGDSATSTGTTGTTGEPLPDCGGAQEEGACEGIEGCRWIFNLGCILECDVISGEATCLMQLDCEWSPSDGCRLPDTIETDT